MAALPGHRGQIARSINMRVRHRVPQIFNIALVDMLCCSLGCFILFTLVYGQRFEASNKEGTAKEQEIRKLKSFQELLSARLEKLRAEEAALRKLLSDTTTSEQASKKQVEELIAKLAALDRDKLGLETNLKDRDKLLSELEKKRLALDNLLALRLKEIEDLEKKVLALGKDKTKLEEDKTVST